MAAIAADAEAQGLTRSAIFTRIWATAHAALGVPAPGLDGVDFGVEIPALDEPWYCCAEPTEQQLAAF